MKNQNYSILKLTIILILFFAPIIIFVRERLEASLFGEFVNSTHGFWIMLFITITIVLLFNYLLISKLFPKSQYITTIICDREIKSASKNIFIIYYIIGWFIYGLTLSFRDESDTMYQYLNFYMPYIILSTIYLFITISYQIKNKQLRRLGNTNHYAIIIIVSMLIFLIIYGISYLIPIGSGILTEEGRDYLLFNLFISVPVEEMVFRGLFIEVVMIVMNEIYFDAKKIPEQKRNKNIKITIIITITLSSLLFALYHINRYGTDFYTILYLIILGNGIAIAYYLAGISSSNIIHLINNLIANFSAFLPLAILLLNNP